MSIKFAPLLHWLENQDQYANKFEMCSWRTCMGGFAERHGPDLELTEIQEDQLFYPNNLAYAHVTPLRAATTLKHFIATGEIDWHITTSS